MMCAGITAHAFEKKPVKIEALDADFLLYIAEMDNIENQWFDPLTLEQATNEKTIKADSNEAMNATQNPPQKNENATDEGVK